ncbi:MAG: NAD-binding protein [Anaeromyxobacter sp.]
MLDGPDGALAGLGEGDVLVDLTTAGVAAARAASERAARAGARFLACPVLGSKAAAEQGQVVLVCGGPGPARERARPALHAISSRLFELDDPAQAALMKLCINAIGGAMITGFAEALALGGAGGLEIWRMVEVLQASSFHSPLFLMKGELIEKGDYAPRFRLSLAEKDQRLAQEAAAGLGCRLPINDAVRRLLHEAAEAGGDRDFCAVAEHLRKKKGLG